jgi:hypothetical protein
MRAIWKKGRGSLKGKLPPSNQSPCSTWTFYEDPDGGKGPWPGFLCREITDLRIISVISGKLVWRHGFFCICVGSVPHRPGPCDNHNLEATAPGTAALASIEFRRPSRSEDVGSPRFNCRRFFLSGSKSASPLRRAPLTACVLKCTVLM